MSVDSLLCHYCTQSFYLMQSFTNGGGILRVSEGNWHHTLTDLVCWIIYVLADLAEVIPIIV